MNTKKPPALVKWFKNILHHRLNRVMVYVYRHTIEATRDLNQQNITASIGETPMIRRWAEHCWDIAVHYVRMFLYSFLTEEQLYDIIEKAEDEYLEASIAQNKIITEIREILREQYELEGYSHDEIQAKIQKEITAMVEGR